MRPGDLERIIGAAAAGGWDWFDQIPDTKVRAALELKRAKTAEDRRTIAAAWAEFAATPGGRMALQALFDATLNRTVFFVGLGTDAQSMAMFGAFREGQNALAQEIARQIAAGREDDPPKPRET